MRILLTGGSGNLGKELIKINPDISAPNSKILDIRSADSLYHFFSKNSFDIVIHAAAMTDTVKCETKISDCISTNIIGTANLMLMQSIYNFKLIYISTDYVFDGKHGYYKTSHPINPISNYAKSKASAELAVRMNENNLIIRTSFFPLEFKHKAAFVDQYTTKDFVDIIAPIIYKEIISGKSGIIHVGTKRDSIYNKVKERYPKIKKISIMDITSVSIPKDTSLII